VSSDGVRLIFFPSAERAATLKLSSPTIVAARATILEREETHWVVTQAITELLEGIGIG
jgi:hypothetical protein